MINGGNEMNEDNKALYDISEFLLNCVIISISLLLFWLVMHLLTVDFAYEIHSKWFDISKKEYEVMNYYGMAFMKIFMFIVFIIPYISIRLLIRKREHN
jgi:hypothetical protein